MPGLVQNVVVALAVGAAAGSVGAFLILRRMALVGDALSHVALPGIAVALLYGTDPFWGVVVCLVGAALVVWWLEGLSNLPAEALVGVLFTASLAVGTLLVPGEALEESLFGAFPSLSALALAALVAAAGVATAVSFVGARRFLLRILSPELARTSGVTRRADLVLLLNFALVVALGIKLVGALLMGALTIIPASVAKNVSRSVAGYMVVSVLIGSLNAVAGVVVSREFGLLPGPTIILLGVALFVSSLGWSSARSQP
jgi:zinc transport system permease protein